MVRAWHGVGLRLGWGTESRVGSVRKCGGDWEWRAVEVWLAEGAGTRGVERGQAVGE